MKSILGFFRDEGGATAIEYALLAALIALAIAIGASALGISISNFFDNIADWLDGIPMPPTPQ